MKKEYKYITIVFFGFMALLYLAKPLRSLLSTYISGETEIDLIAGIIVRFSILLLLIKLLKKFHLTSFSGFRKGNKIQNLQVLILPCAFIVMGIMSAWTTFSNTNITLLLLFTSSVFLVGFIEEICFRGIILPFFIRALQNKKNVLIIASLLTALLFGVTHYANLFREPDNFWGITSQVFFATSIGFFFCGLFLRTRSMLATALFHGFVNFSFGTGVLQTELPTIIEKPISEAINWSSVIPTTLFFSFIFMGGLYTILQIDKKEILEELGIEVKL